MLCSRRMPYAVLSLITSTVGHGARWHPRQEFFPIEGRTFVEGEFIDTVTAIPDSRTEIVMLRTPGGGTMVELSSFVRPDPVPGSSAAMANELGLRSLSFEVDDLQAHVDRMAAEGYGLVGGVGEYEAAWRMAYVRGPEGIIVALAERIG